MSGEIHNMSHEQAKEWWQVANREDLKDNEIRLFIVASLLHDGWMGINVAFKIFEKFGMFSKPHSAIRQDFSKFSHPEIWDENGNPIFQK